jgi:hypothetical protein
MLNASGSWHVMRARTAHARAAGSAVVERAGD